MLDLLIPRRNATAVGNYAPSSDFWYIPAAQPTASKINVTDETAMTYSAPWACTRLLSSSGAMLPLNLYRRLMGSGREIARDDSRNRLVHDAPNTEMTSMMFRAQAFAQQINAGNCYSEIQRNARDFPVALWPIHHSRVRVIRDDSEQLLYEVRNNDGTKVYIEPENMLHVQSTMSDDGITGKGVIRQAREAIGFGIITEQYGAAWFSTGGIPRVVVESPSKWTPESRANFRKEWQEIYGGSDASRVGLMTEGSKLHQLNIAQEDSQFLTTRQHNIEEISRWYGVPPHKIGHLLRATFSNIEHQSIEYVTDSLLPWLVQWEQALNNKLLTPAEQVEYFFKFNVNALLRGDADSRGNFYRTMTGIGAYSRNKVLELEDENPVPGGDTILVQGAMVALDDDGYPMPPATAQAEVVGSVDAPNETAKSATDAEGAAATGNVQSTALNGAQIVALVDIANRLATEQLPPEGTRALIKAAFPLMDDKLIETMVSELDKFTPKPAEPEPSPFGPTAPADGSTSASTTAAETASALATTTQAIADLRAELTASRTTEAKPDGREAALHAAARSMLRGALNRMFNFQASRVREAAGKPKSFIGWLDEFFGDKHRETFHEAIADPCQALIVLGIDIDISALVRGEVESSRSQLLEASGCAPAEFANAIEACVSDWEKNRAARVAESIVAGVTA